MIYCHIIPTNLSLKVVSLVIDTSRFLKQVKLYPTVKPIDFCGLFLAHEHMLKATAVCDVTAWRSCIVSEPEIFQ